jgi:ribosome-binding factor A
MTQRTERIDEQLRQEIGQALEREVTDPRIGFVTVTKVETVPDLSRARVWVSIIGTPDERKLTLAALKGAMPFIRYGLGKKLTLRRIPELDVRMDDTIERGTRVLQILNELNLGQTPEAPKGAGESLPTPVAIVRHEGDPVDETELGGAAAEADAAVKARPTAPRTGGRKAGSWREASKGKPKPQRRSR